MQVYYFDLKYFLNKKKFIQLLCSKSPKSMIAVFS